MYFFCAHLMMTAPFELTVCQTAALTDSGTDVALTLSRSGATTAFGVRNVCVCVVRIYHAWEGFRELKVKV